MKLFKLDPMTVLLVVVVIGVVVTMSTQASTQTSTQESAQSGDRSMISSEALQASVLSVSAVLPVRR